MYKLREIMRDYVNCLIGEINRIDIELVAIFFAMLKLQKILIS